VKKYLILFLVLFAFSTVVFGTTTVRRPTSIKQVAGYPAGTAWDIHFTNPGSAGEAADSTIWGPVWNLNDFAKRPTAMSLIYKMVSDSAGGTKNDVACSLAVEGRYMPAAGGGWMQPEDSTRLIELPNHQAKWRPRSYTTTGPEKTKYWFRLDVPIIINAQDSVFACMGTIWIPPLVTELRLRQWAATTGDSLKYAHFRVVFAK